MIVLRAERVALLAIGAAVIVAAAITMLLRMDDRTVFTVLVPGVVLGLILIVVSLRIGPTSGTR